MSARARRRARRAALARRFRFFRHGPTFAGLDVPCFPFPAREALLLARAEVWAFHVGADAADCPAPMPDEDTGERQALVVACFDRAPLHGSPAVLYSVPEVATLNDYARRATHADALAQLREGVSR